MPDSVTVTINLEGSFTGWRVEAALRCWQSISKVNQGLAICVDTSGISQIDQSGRCLLAAMRKQGVDLASDTQSLKENNPTNSGKSANDPVRQGETTIQTRRCAIKVTDRSSDTWLMISYTVLLGAILPVGLWISQTYYHGSLNNFIVLGIVSLAGLGLIWRHRSENARRLHSAINIYAARKIAR